MCWVYLKKIDDNISVSLSWKSLAEWPYNLSIFVWRTELWKILKIKYYKLTNWTHDSKKGYIPGKIAVELSYSLWKGESVETKHLKLGTHLNHEAWIKKHFTSKDTLFCPQDYNVQGQHSQKFQGEVGSSTGRRASKRTHSC